MASRIAIAGYGIEGRANYAYWNKDGNELTIVDERETIDDLPFGAQTILGAGAFSKLADFDMVIRTASLAPKRINTNGKIWSATNEFFADCPVPIIGVTGTKGKGTTSSLIASVLQAAGKTVHLVGNIGISALAELDSIHSGDIVVFELSSFQLWDLQTSPQTAVVLGIEPDHLDIHSDFEEYIAAKNNITSHQANEDIVIYNVSNEWSRRIGQGSKSQQQPYPDSHYAHTVNDFFYMGANQLCATSVLKIPGQHNIENACAAIAASWQFTQDKAAIEAGLAGFSGLPHRLKFVGEVRGVKFYDDSIATTPGSAIAAIRSFKEPKVLILGGHEKGSNYHELLQECRNDQVSVIAIGANRQYIAELCAEAGVECGVEPGTMSQIIQRSMMEAKPGWIVLLSPAAASFDMFKNYSDRGDQFIQAVEDL